MRSAALVAVPLFAAALVSCQVGQSEIDVTEEPIRQGIYTVTTVLLESDCEPFFDETMALFPGWPYERLPVVVEDRMWTPQIKLNIPLLRLGTMPALTGGLDREGRPLGSLLAQRMYGEFSSEYFYCEVDPLTWTNFQMELRAFAVGSDRLIVDIDALWEDPFDCTEEFTELGWFPPPVTPEASCREVVRVILDLDEPCPRECEFQVEGRLTDEGIEEIERYGAIFAGWDLFMDCQC